MTTKLIVTTGDTVSGAEIVEYLGVVRGLVVRVPSFHQGLQALGSALSGDWQAGAKMYEEVCDDARSQAFKRMVEIAKERGADAIIAMRYTATDIKESATEVLAYGTAVKIKYPEARPVPT